MFGNLDIKNLFYGFFDSLYPWIAEFDNFPGVGKDNMIVVTVKIRFFVLRLVLPKLVLSYQSAFQQ
jgi:hypothetical protein